jgi:hypothetical protein
MASFISYWTGIDWAEITAERVDAPALKSGPGVGGHTIAGMQLAFDFYYRGMKIIDAIRAPEGDLPHSVYNAVSRAKKAAKDDLQDSARAGWGHGVNDLEEAFEHLAKNGGRWTDNNVRMYGAGGSGSGAINGHGVYTTAQFAYNFFNSIDAKMKAAAEAAQEHMRAADKLAEAAAKDGWNKVGTKQWEQVGEALVKIQHVSDHLQKHLWLVCPKFEVPDVVNDALETCDKFVGAATEVRGAVEAFDKCQRAGFGTGASALLTVLKTGMGKVPVLGEVYAEAIGLIPEIASGFQAIADRQRMLLNIAIYGPAHGQQMPDR